MRGRNRGAVYVTPIDEVNTAGVPQTKTEYVGLEGDLQVQRHSEYITLLLKKED